MIFLIVDTNNYGLLQGLDFLMKIKVVVDVEKGLYMFEMGQEWQLKFYL